MPAIASLADLKKAQNDIIDFKVKYPIECKEFEKLIKKHRKNGYKNFCKLFLEEETPESLKI